MMNKFLFLCLPLLAAFPASGGESASIPDRPSIPPSRCPAGVAFMEQNAGVMSSINNRMTVDALYGFTTGRGYQFCSTPNGSHDLYFLTGWFRGTQSVRNGSEWTMHLSEELLPFYAGYRYTLRLTPAWSAYLGVHAGYVYAHSTQKTTGEDEEGPFHQKLSASSNSFACGASVGVTWRFSPHWAATAGYTFTEMLTMKRFTNESSYAQSSSAAAGTVHVGLTMIFGDTAELRARQKMSKWLFSGSMGMMNSNRGFVNNGDQWVCSDLYGGGFSVSREMASKGKLTQRLGFSTGYHYGDVTNRYGGDMVAEEGIENIDYSVHNEVNAIPLLATWDWVYALRPSFALRCGLSGGAIVRHSDFDLEHNDIYTTPDGGTESLHIRAHSSSTRVQPAVGLRLGIEVRMNARSMMFIGYDYMQTFGKDCRTPSDPSGVYSEDCANVPKRNRYYGLVTAGVTYVY